MQVEKFTDCCKRLAEELICLRTGECYTAQGLLSNANRNFAAGS